MTSSAPKSTTTTMVNFTCRAMPIPARLLTDSSLVKLNRLPGEHNSTVPLTWLFLIG